MSLASCLLSIGPSGARAFDLPLVAFVRQSPPSGKIAKNAVWQGDTLH
jgi:hypothetical protein